MRKHHPTSALLALAALALAACGQGGTSATAPGHGTVVLSINGAQAMASVTTVAVSVAPAGVSADLALDQATGSFGGTLSLPAGAQVITARAFAGATLVAQGSAAVTVAGGQTLVVAITVLDVTGPEPTPDHAPILTALTASAATREVGQSVTLTATAVDVDGDPIAFAWTASPAGCVTFSPTSSISLGAAATTATAALAGPCTLTVEAASRGLTDSLSAAVEILLPAVLDGTFVPQPVIGAVEFLAPATAAVLRTDADATVRRPWASGAPVTIRFSWDATPWLPPSVASLSDSCGGTVRPAATTATSGTFEWTPTGGPVCLLTAGLERQGLTDAFPIAVVVGPPAPPACTWTEVAFHDLATQPAGAIVRNGGLGGQGVAVVDGRPAWLQTSDWNVLLIPNGLTTGDDVFAVEVDAFVPATAVSYRTASLVPFTTSDTAPGPNGTCQFLGGVFGSLWVRPGAGSTVEWWSAACPNTLLTAEPVASPAAAWHRLRLEGVRSTCSYRLLLEGALLSTWTGACDPGGGYLNLFGHTQGQGAQVAWSNLAVFKGSARTCLP
jgi:hypothetical protein